MCVQFTVHKCLRHASEKMEKVFSPQNFVGKARSSSDDATIFVEHKIMMRSLNVGMRVVRRSYRYRVYFVSETETSCQCVTKAPSKIAVEGDGFAIDSLDTCRLCGW
jgi:hypothetical protein